MTDIEQENRELREENRLVTEQNTQMAEALLKAEREIERLDWELDAVQSDPSARNDVLEEAAKDCESCLCPRVEGNGCHLADAGRIRSLKVKP